MKTPLMFFLHTVNASAGQNSFCICRSFSHWHQYFLWCSFFKDRCTQALFEQNWHQTQKPDVERPQVRQHHSVPENGLLKSFLPVLFLPLWFQSPSHQREEQSSFHFLPLPVSPTYGRALWWMLSCWKRQGEPQHLPLGWTGALPDKGRWELHQAENWECFNPGLGSLYSNDPIREAINT